VAGFTSFDSISSVKSLDSIFEWSSEESLSIILLLGMTPCFLLDTDFIIFLFNIRMNIKIHKMIIKTIISKGPSPPNMLSPTFN